MFEGWWVVSKPAILCTVWWMVCMVCLQASPVFTSIGFRTSLRRTNDLWPLPNPLFELILTELGEGWFRMSEVAFSRKIECNESNDENSSNVFCERDYVTIITRYFEMSVRIRAFHFYAPQSRKT